MLGHCQARIKIFRGPGPNECSSPLYTNLLYIYIWCFSYPGQHICSYTLIYLVMSSKINTEKNRKNILDFLNRNGCRWYKASIWFKHLIILFRNSCSKFYFSAPFRYFCSQRTWFTFKYSFKVKRIFFFFFFFCKRLHCNPLQI
jgi:hypothetical protein